MNSNFTITDESLDTSEDESKSYEITSAFKLKTKWETLHISADMIWGGVTITIDEEPEHIEINLTTEQAQLLLISFAKVVRDVTCGLN